MKKILLLFASTLLFCWQVNAQTCASPTVLTNGVALTSETSCGTGAQLLNNPCNSFYVADVAAEEAHIYSYTTGAFPEYISVDYSNVGTNYSGVTIVSGTCDDAAAVCLGSYYTGSGTAAGTATTANVVPAATTIYVYLSTWPTPNCVASYDILLTGTPVSCPPPSAPLTSLLSEDSAVLSWTTGGASDWFVEYGLAGFTPGTGTLISGASIDTLSGLTAETDYEWYVRDYCGPADSSAWVGPISFTTPCAAILAPYTENFDALPNTSPWTALPACWETQVGPDFWDVTNDVFNTGHTYLPNIGDHTTGSGNYMWIDASTGGLNIDVNEMVTPFIDMSPLTTPYVGFWYASNTTLTAFHGISLDAWDGVAWVNVITFSGDFTGWMELASVLPAGIPSTTKFRIQAINNVAAGYQNDLGVDDFFLVEAPTCFEPSALASNVLSADSAVLSWTTGGSSDWIVEYGPVGFAPGTGVGTLVNVTGTAMDTLSGLTAETDYEWYVKDYCGPADSSAFVGPIAFTTLPTCPGSTNFSDSLVSQTEVQLSWDAISSASSWQIEYGFDGFVQGSTDGTYATAGTSPFNIAGLQADTTYDFYVRDICGPGDTSLWVGPLSVFTGYCLVSTTNSGDYLSAVSTSGATLNASYTATTQPAGSYADETAQVIETYPNGTLDFSTTYVGGSNGVNIWVDWNNDLDFDDAGENIFYLANTLATKTASLTVPGVTPLGSYRVRVRGQFGSTANPPSCGNVAWGSTVDFTLVVSTPPSCLPPANVMTTVISYDSALVYYDAYASGTASMIEYGPAGFTPGTGTGTVVSTTLDSLYLTGLSAVTTYDVYTSTDCSGTTSDSSSVTGPVSFTTPVSCPAPTALTVDSIGTDTVLVFWTSGGSNDYIVEYGEAGFTQGSPAGTVVLLSTDTFTVLTGLTAGTGYDVYVRDYCGVADSSVWTPVESFFTLCDVTSVFPAVENFDALTPNNSQPFACILTDNVTNCWSNEAANTNLWTASSIATGSGTTGPSADHTGGGNYLFLESSSCSNNTSYLYSTEYDVSSLLNPRLKFWYHMYGATTGTLSVEVSTDQGTTWSPSVWTLSGDQGDSWIEANVDLVAYASAPSLILRFTGITGTSFTSDMAIDDVQIDELPTCFEPLAFVSSNIGEDSIDLAWTSNMGSTAYDVVYGAAGFTPGAVATVTGITDTFYTVTGLTPFTDYEVYVRANCGPADSSVWTGPISFTTLATCLEPLALGANPVFADSANLFWTANGVATEWEIEIDTAGFTATGTPNVLGVTDTFNVVTGLTSNTAYDYYVRSRCSASDSSVWSGPFTFTTSANCGDTVGNLIYDLVNTAQVLVNFQATPGDFATLEFIQGQVETCCDEVLVYDGLNGTGNILYGSLTGGGLADYSGEGTIESTTGQISLVVNSDVSVTAASSGFVPFEVVLNCVAPPLSELGVTEVIAPVSECGQEFTPISVVVENFGYATVYYAPVVVELSGDITGVYTMVLDSIPALTSDTLLLDSINTLGGGDFTVTAFTNLANDEDTSNDTTIVAVSIGEIPVAPVFAPVMACEGEMLNLTATNLGQLNWYTSDTASAPAFVGDTLMFTASSDTSFYVSQQETGSDTLTIDMFDTFSDGWDGASLNVFVNGAPVPGSPFTMAAVVSQQETFFVNHNDFVSFLFTTGTWPTEPAYNIVTSDGTIIFNDGGGFGGANTTPAGGFNQNVQIAGCPSELVLVEVTVGQTYMDTVAVVACDGMMINGVMVTTDGTYTDSLTSVGGCDSIVTIDLTINNSSSTSASVCGATSVTLADGTVVTASGSYSATVANAAGCDSVIAYTVTIDAAYEVTQDVILCAGDSLVVGANVYTVGGNYVDVLPSAIGCDSVVTSNVTVLPAVDVTIGGVTTVCDNAGVIDLSLDPVGGTLAGSGVTGNSFDPAVAGVGSHTLTYTFTDGNGCDAKASLDLEVVVCTGIDNIEGIETISIYPNPFISTINVLFDDATSSELTIKLFDITGRVLLTETVNTTIGTNSFALEVPAEVAAGVTVMQIERDGAIYSTTLIKK